jgi:serine/threonine protein kinase
MFLWHNRYNDMKGGIISMSNTGTFTLQSKLTRYTLKERIGSGGMATVYRAWDNNLDRDVAIKVLHEHLSFEQTFQERFEREGKFVAGFHHPHIVQVYDSASVETDDIPIYYMVMPYLTGSTLEGVISEHRQRNESIPTNVIIKLLHEIASALDYAHARGMIHRDIKPANIIYDSHDRAILTDFGIARLVDMGNLTVEGMTIGTPAYMSPEQAQGLEIDQQADIYSLGVIAYELITGTPPFGDGTISVMLQHVNAPVPQISDILNMPNDSLDAVMNRVLAKSSKYRYPTATEFAEELSNALQNKPLKNPPQVTKVLEPVKAIAESDQSYDGKPKIKLKNSDSSNSPLGLLAIGLGLTAFVLVIALLTQSPQQVAIEPTLVSLSVKSSEVADSMTGDIFFTSTFDDADSMLEAWDQSDSQFMSREIVDGQYNITNHRANTATTSLFDQIYTYDDVTLTLDAHLVDASSLASGYGIVFRYVDPENYNVFAVDGRGRFSIWVREAGQWLELRDADSQWTEHPAINADSESNTLTIEIFDNTLRGFVNDVEVTHVQDDTIATGGIGIYLATTPQGEASIEVDSFTVSESNQPVSAMTDDSDNQTESMTADE